QVNDEVAVLGWRPRGIRHGDPDDVVGVRVPGGIRVEDAVLVDVAEGDENAVREMAGTTGLREVEERRGRRGARKREREIDGEVPLILQVRLCDHGSDGRSGRGPGERRVPAHRQEHRVRLLRGGSAEQLTLELNSGRRTTAAASSGETGAKC